ncbi:Glycosyltransferase, GT2 family [Lachnospiraceae bacterium KH1T2]|nr:Glycosyltransferase, GT2 family [Lachnospiraceae bacterium KH1T2]
MQYVESRIDNKNISNYKFVYDIGYWDNNLGENLMKNFKDIDIAFVVLHYNALETTVNCIKSIKKNIDTALYKIIVVDNNSPDKSGLILKKIFFKDNYVEVIILKENLGFANGNNRGIEFVRKRYKSLFICCINNDILIEQSDFYKNLLNEYKKSKAALIGPMVIGKDGLAQCYINELKSKEEYEKILEIYKAGTIPSKNFVKQFFITHGLGYKIYRWHMSKKKFQYIRHENVILHGCCIIFTPVFFNKLNGFNPNTFLYREEELLYLSIRINDLKSVYLPCISVKHLEDVSTDSLFKKKAAKKKLIIENQIKSLQVLISELEKIGL